MFLLLLQSLSLDTWVIIGMQLLSLSFTAGVYVATTRFHGRRITNLETDSKEKREVLEKHGEDIQGLKVHTNYPEEHRA